ncbi:SoxR reducing system RseC family protein [Bacteroidota bacterium]
MSGNQTIDHVGFVESVNDSMATIKINSVSACASCHAKGACSAADQEEKVLTVSTGMQAFHPGEQVRVKISKRTGLKAVAMGYVYPFLLLMVVLIALSIAGIPELQAGLWSLIALVPYYIGIYLLRNRVGNTFSFTMEKI